MVNLQKYTDRFVEKFFLPFVPKSISPNQVTWVRIFLLPVIFYLLINKYYVLGFIIFVIAAATDVLDGAMARTRDQITELGKILDPIADKGLIFLVGIIFIPKLFGWKLVYLILLLEAFQTLMAHLAMRRLKTAPGANWAGKVKMIIQCVAFGFIFLGILSNASFWYDYAGWLLYSSLVFTFLQSFLYPKFKTN